MRKECVPLVRRHRKFESLGITVRADVTSVGPICLRRKTGLHPVERRVVHAVLDPEAHKRAGYDLGDRRARPLLERDLYGCAGDEHQAARIAEACAIVFFLNRRLICFSLEAPQETRV